MSQQTTNSSIIQQKITKVNGQIGIKKYQRSELLGMGANSKCYKCIQLESKDQYAVKIITKSKFKSNSEKEKVLTQIKIHKTLYNEHIVKFFTAFEDIENIYIIIELCQKQTLLDLMKKRGKINFKDARKYIVQIIQAVQYMHQNQIIHRDLKLANIFLDQDMKIKVGDFGEATKLQFADEKKVSVCGTLNYLAPEIVSGPFGHSFEVDFWAIGVVSFAMLFGKSPFQSKDENETLEKIKQCKYEFPNVAVPSEAKDFIRKILVADPKKRMNFQNMLQHPFLSNAQIDQVEQSNFLNRIFSSQIFSSKILQSSGSLLMKSKSSQNLQKKFALRQALSPKAQLKTASSYSQIRQKNLKLNFSYVESFIDLSKKYGFGYLINKNTFGIIFNDGSVILSDEMKKKIYFVKNPKVNQVRIEEYSSETVPNERDFQKKYLLLDRFIGLLKIQIAKNNLIENQTQKCEKLVFVKEWWKNSQATMFSLSNGHFQVSFVDGSKTVFGPSKNTIFIKSKDGIDNFFDKIEEALNSKDSELKKKSLYTKEIYLSIQRKRVSKIHHVN